MIIMTSDTQGDIFKILLAKEFFNPQKNDILIIAGDFGFVFANDKRENDFLDFLDSSFNFKICFIDGNHENFDALYSYPEEIWKGGYIHRIRKNIIHLMRGQIYSIEGKTIFTMGGAYSVDRGFRKSWWSQELPNNDEYKQALKNLADHNMKVDYVITHTAPRPMIYPLKKAPDVHETELSNFLDYLYFDLEYKHWYSGHFHIDRDINDKYSFLWDRIIVI